MVTARFIGILVPGLHALPPELYEKALPTLSSLPRSNQLLGQESEQLAGLAEGTDPCAGRDELLVMDPKQVAGLQVV
jgi:hypothetical protein